MIRALYVPMEFLLEKAFDVARSYRIVGPEWIRQGPPHYDINARVPLNAAIDDIPGMFRTLMEERFMLQAHRELRVMKAYELVLAKGGPKLAESAASQARLSTTRPAITFTGTMQTSGDIASLCEKQLDRPVLDKTGLTGKYDFKLTFSPERLTADGDASTNDSGPNLFTALDQQLGLRLQVTSAKVDVVVVDRVNKMPTEN